MNVVLFRQRAVVKRAVPKELWWPTADFTDTPEEFWSPYNAVGLIDVICRQGVATAEIFVYGRRDVVYAPYTYNQPGVGEITRSRILRFSCRPTFTTYRDGFLNIQYHANAIGTAPGRQPVSAARFIALEKTSTVFEAMELFNQYFQTQ